jgi:hypothetical protein
VARALGRATVSDLPWVRLSQRRCRAVREPGTSYWGRCELRAGHDGDHALDRAMDTPRWSTRWTDATRYSATAHQMAADLRAKADRNLDHG